MRATAPPDGGGAVPRSSWSGDDPSASVSSPVEPCEARVENSRRRRSAGARCRSRSPQLIRDEEQDEDAHGDEAVRPMAGRCVARPPILRACPDRNSGACEWRGSHPLGAPPYTHSTCSRETLCQPVVRLRSAVCLLGRFPALAGVDLDVDEGEVVLLSGGNGAGKTTLLRLLAGTGVVALRDGWVLGHDLADDRRSHRRLLGLVGPRDRLLRRPHGGRERALRGPCGGAWTTPPSRRSSNSSASHRCATLLHRGSRPASDAGWRSRSRWCGPLACCFSTNPTPASTPRALGT